MKIMRDFRIGFVISVWTWVLMSNCISSEARTYCMPDYPCDSGESVGGQGGAGGAGGMGGGVK